MSHRMSLRSVLVLASLALVWACGCRKNEAGPEGGSPATSARELGMPLAGAPEVSPEDLLKDPSAYDGKTVRVSGRVEDFCHHRRAWFAVAGGAGQAMVRIFTAPRFEVPADCIGKRAVAEGKVELVTIPADQVAYYAKQHKFLAGVQPPKEGEPLLQPIIRAFGARFE